MAAKKGVGLTSQPPQAKKGGGKQKGKGKVKEQQLSGLTPGQNQLINQTQAQDYWLGEQGAGFRPAIEESFRQPFDWNSMPAAPVQGDYQGWVDEQMGNYNSAYDQRMDPVFKKQLAEFESDAYNKGWAPGSENYDREKKNLLASQNDARTQAYAQNQGQAVNSAGQLFNVGQQARGSAVAEGMQQRYQPFNEMQMFYGAQSPMGLQNLGYSQARQMQQDEIANQRWMMKNTPRGGGGGGGGSNPLWAQYGFSSPMEYDAYKTAQARANQQWEWDNNPNYNQPRGPSTGSQLLGGALGLGTSLLGMYAGKNWF